MRERRYWKITLLIFAVAAMILGAPDIVHGQGAPPAKRSPPFSDSSSRNVIIIGFVGGFVSPDDAKHPEVQFAAYLDFRVWDTAASMIDSDLPGEESIAQAPLSLRVALLQIPQARFPSTWN
jgi:hypothetical protein